MVFVTGGTGFIGTHLLRELLARGENIRALKRRHSRILLEEHLSKQMEWIEGDVLDVTCLQESMREGDEVYHCAAFVRFQPKDSPQLMRVNVEGTANVVNIGMEKKIRKLVHVSSVAAIGRNPFDEKVNENTPWENQSGNSKYSISKFLAEREVWRAIAEGLNAVIVNPSLIIGTGNWDDGSPEMFTRVWNGLFAYTEGGTGIVAARDVVNVMIHLMKSDISNERFILSAEDWSFKDLFFLIADQLHVKRPWLNVRPWMMDFFWRTEQMKQLFLRKKPLISRETARAATRWSHFDNTKVIRATNYTFTPIKTYIEEIAAKFLDEKRAAITG